MVFGWSGAHEAQRVHGGDGPRSHREYIAQDAADAGRRALIGFDVGGVVVALHFEDQRIAVANVDHACILTRSANYLRTLGRQSAQPFLRRLVGTMLIPHRREDTQFGQRRRPAQKVQDALILVGVQAVVRDKAIVDFRFGHVAQRSHGRWLPELMSALFRSDLAKEKDGKDRNRPTKKKRPSNCARPKSNREVEIDYLSAPNFKL